ncbi:MAG: hypothetical protein ABI855_00580 [Bacteroidota bacterium]
MDWDDDDEDFNFDYDSLSPEEKEEIERDMREKDEKLHNHPLYKKAEDIFDTVHAFIECLDGDMKEMYGSTLMESAMMLAPKFSGAFGSESYLICMQNASIMRYHAAYLLTSTFDMDAFGEIKKTDEKYIKLLHDDMLEFQKLFKEWVHTFDSLENEGIEDEWGLYKRKPY